MRSFKSILLEAVMSYDQALKMLGLSSNFTKDELEKTRKKLALQYHPDRPGGDLEKMKLVNAAYDIVSKKDNSFTRQQGNPPPTTTHKVYDKIDWKSNPKYKRFIKDLKSNFIITGDVNDYRVTSAVAGQRTVRFANAKIENKILTSVFEMKIKNGVIWIELDAHEWKTGPALSLQVYIRPPSSEDELQTHVMNLLDDVLLDAFGIKD